MYLNFSDESSVPLDDMQAAQRTINGLISAIDILERQVARMEDKFDDLYRSGCQA